MNMQASENTPLLSQLMALASHDEYASQFGECPCRKCHPVPIADDDGLNEEPTSYRRKGE